MRWLVPKRFPHGLIGSVLAVVGGANVFGTIRHGRLVTPEMSILIAALAIGNAKSGTALLTSSSSSSSLFRTMSDVQTCLSYSLVRFACFQTGEWLAPLDALCGVYVIVLLIRLVSHVLACKPAVRPVVLAGTVSASSFCCYPLQMGFFPRTWYPLVRTTFTDQHSAMASFVYAPTIWLISLVMFCATLYERKKVGDATLVILSALAPSLLIVTVLSQDTFYTETSTQQLVLGVPGTDPTRFLKRAVGA